jgi:hypothetical protein
MTRAMSEVKPFGALLRDANESSFSWPQIKRSLSLKYVL